MYYKVVDREFLKPSSSKQGHPQLQKESRESGGEGKESRLARDDVQEVYGDKRGNYQDPRVVYQAENWQRGKKEGPQHHRRLFRVIDH